MSKLIKLALLLLLATPASAAIALVQHTNKDAAATTSTTLAYGSNVAANNLLVVCTRTGGSSAVTITITDSIGNTWHNLTSQSVSSIGTDQCAWAVNTTSSADTITDSLSSSVTLRMAIYEFSGAATVSPVDAENNATTATSTAPAAASITPAANNELILAFQAEGAGSISCSAGTNFTLQDAVPSSSDCRLSVETWIQTTATATTGPATYGVSTTWMAGIVAFKPAGAVAVTTFPQVVKGESNEIWLQSPTLTQGFSILCSSLVHGCPADVCSDIELGHSYRSSRSSRSGNQRRATQLLSGNGRIADGHGRQRWCRLILHGDLGYLRIDPYFHSGVGQHFGEIYGSSYGSDDCYFGGALCSNHMPASGVVS